MTRSQSNSHHDASRNPSSDKPSLRDRMSQDLQLRGMADRTQSGNLRVSIHVRRGLLSKSEAG